MKLTFFPASVSSTNSCNVVDNITPSDMTPSVKNMLHSTHEQITLTDIEAPGGEKQNKPPTIHMIKQFSGNYSKKIIK